MEKLPPEARQCLEAAEAWLHLGSHAEANEELDKIAPELRDHPKVLDVRWEIYAKAQKWEGALEIANALITARPTRLKEWLRKSQALNALGHSADALENLRSAIKSNDWSVDDLYDLASEVAQLGGTNEALECLRAGAGKPGFAELKAIALATDLFREIHPQIRAMEEGGHSAC